MEEWASVPLAFLTAWHMLITRGTLQKKETILVHAAGSGVGSAAIQIAKLTGARVIATAGSDEKLCRAKSLGPDDLINYKTKDFVSEVMRLTRGEGVDLVFEHIGGNILEKSILCLRKKGRLLTCGVTAGGNINIDIRYLFRKQLSVIGSYMGGIPELKRVVRRLDAGKLKPVVDTILPHRQARVAFSRMLKREHFGKIILKP